MYYCFKNSEKHQDNKNSPLIYKLNDIIVLLQPIGHPAKAQTMSLFNLMHPILKLYYLLKLQETL